MKIKVTIRPSGLWCCKGLHPERSTWRRTRFYGAGGLEAARDHVINEHIDK